MLADTEVQVLTSRVIRLEMAGAFVSKQGPVRWTEIGRSAQEPRDALPQNVEHFARGFASSDALWVRRKYGQIAIPAVRQFTPLHLFDLGGEFRIPGTVILEKLLPFTVSRRAACSDSVVEVLVD